MNVAKTFGLVLFVVGCSVEVGCHNPNNQPQTSRNEPFNLLAVDRTYEISDLGGLYGGCFFPEPGDPPPPTVDPYWALERLITQTVDPGSWSANGGQATIARQGTQDVIRQTPENHRQIENFLEQLREERLSSRRASEVRGS